MYIENGLRVLSITACLSTLFGCGEAENSSNEPLTRHSSRADEVAACVEKGIQYFKDIGSYPTLSSAPNAGRLADEVALERCRRTVTAFP